MAISVPSPSVRPDASPLRPILSSAPTGAFGGDLAEGVASIGQVTGELGKVLEEHNQVLKDLNGIADVNENISGFGSELRGMEINFNQLKGKAAAEAGPEMLAKAAELQKQYASKLTGLRERNMFDSNSRTMLDRVQSTIATHAATQASAYRKQANQSVIDAKAALTNQYPDDPVLYEDFKKTNRQVVTTQAIEDGLDPNSEVDRSIIDHLVATNTSKVAMENLKSLATTSKETMEKYYNDHKGDLYGNDLPTAAAFVSQKMDQYNAFEAADEAVSANLEAQPITDSDAVFEHGVLYAETRNGAGALLNPETGAVGIGQTMPATAEAMAKKLGLKWQPDLMTLKTPAALDYQRKLSYAYWQEGVAAYPGDTEKQLKYYYGGPDQKQWGQDTRGYAANVIAHLGKPLITDLTSLQEAEPRILEEAKAALLKRNPNASNEIIDRTLMHARQKIGVQASAWSAQEAAAGRTVTDALNRVDATGNKPTNLTELTQDDPAVEAAYYAQQPSARRLIDSMLLSNARPTVANMTPSAVATFTELDGLARSDPASFAKLDLGDYPGIMELPAGYKHDFLVRQNTIKANPEKVNPENAFVEQVKAVPAFGAALGTMKITSGSKSYYQLIGAIQAEKDSWTVANPKKHPQEADINSFIARAMAQKYKVVGAPFVPWFDTTKPVLSDTGKPVRAFDISPEDHDQAAIDLQSAGVAPTENNIVRLVRDRAMKKATK